MKLCVAAILAIVFLENFSVHIVRGVFGSQTMARSFCQALMKKTIKLKDIDRYENVANSAVEAVLIVTKKGKKFCVSPERKWVKNAIRHLDKQAALAKLKNRNSPV